MNEQTLRHAKIMIVDDEAANIQLMEDLLRVDGYSQIRAVNDSRQAPAIAAAWQPDLIVLDLHMPNLDGFGVMQEVHSIINEDIFLPVMVVSGDYSADVKRQALATGAKDFLTRPFDAIEVQLRIRNLLEARFLQLQLQDERDNLEDRVIERTEELEQSQLALKESQVEIIVRLALAAELHDDDTGKHNMRVGLIASLLAQTLGLAPEQVELIHRAAPLHDVGKIGVADPILLKPGRLTSDEFEILKEHCRIGAEILSGGHADLVQMSERIALAHHEKWDGTGYPNGLKGEEIPIEARILAIADVFDALTHDRPYKKAWTVEEALREIREQRGKHFDPCIVDAFLTLPHQDLM